MKTTNYIETFISVSEDSPVKKAEIPPSLKGGKKTIAGIQYDLIKNYPYQYTSDDVLFAVYTQKNDTSKNEAQAEREKFFSKGQPCLRSSPLVKRYGWGIHCDSEGRIALYPVESIEYQAFQNDKALKQLRGMRSKRKQPEQGNSMDTCASIAGCHRSDWQVGLLSNNESQG